MPFKFTVDFPHGMSKNGRSYPPEVISDLVKKVEKSETGIVGYTGISDPLNRSVEDASHVAVEAKSTPDGAKITFQAMSNAHGVRFRELMESSQLEFQPTFLGTEDFLNGQPDDLTLVSIDAVQKSPASETGLTLLSIPEAVEEAPRGATQDAKIIDFDPQFLNPYPEIDWASQGLAVSRACVETTQHLWDNFSHALTGIDREDFIFDHVAALLISMGCDPENLPDIEIT